MCVGGVESGVCGFYSITHVTHVGGIKGVFYSVYRGLSPLQEGRLIIAIHPVGLPIHHQSV